jgi:hypothetical protein
MSISCCPLVSKLPTDVLAWEMSYQSSSRRVVGEERVHRSDFTSIGVHTASSLARLDVAPDHRCHVSLVVHEASVKVGSIVWRGRDDVGEASGEWILQEMELRDELAWWHVHVVAKPARDHRVVHDRLVRLVLEVAVPATAELWAGPAVHLFELFFGGTNLDASVDAVGGKRASAIDVPLIEHLLLDRRVATDKVVKGFCLGLRPIRRESEVVVLKIGPDAREIDNRLDANSFELLRVTDTTALEDQGRAQCSTTDDDLFADLDDCAMVLVGCEGLGRDNTDTSRTSVLDDHLVYLRVAHQVQVLVYGPRTMNVCVGTCSTTLGFAGLYFDYNPSRKCTYCHCDDQCRG